MNLYDELIAAFKIFKKYEHEEGLSTRDSEIFAGPDPDDVSEEDSLALQALGWIDSGEECWERSL